MTGNFICFMFLNFFPPVFLPAFRGFLCHSIEFYRFLKFLVFARRFNFNTSKYLKALTNKCTEHFQNKCDSEEFNQKM